MSLMSSDDEDSLSDNKPELSPLEVEELLLVIEKRDDDDDETNNERPISSDNKAKVFPLEIEELFPVLVEETDDDNSANANNNNSARPISRRGRTNLFFFLGSLLYFWLAIWDLPDEDLDEMEHAFGIEDTDVVVDMDQDDFMYLNISSSLVVSFSPDKALSGMAAFCYVLDAGVELKQLQLSPEQQSAHHLLHNFRRLSLQISIGLTFGIAAILEFSSTLFDSEALRFISNHIYLLNAILLVTGKQWHMDSISTTLEVIGDVLFVTGSVNDVVLSYWYIRMTHIWVDDGTAEHAVAMGDLFCGGLWLIDSILYIVADCCSKNDGSVDNDYCEGEYEAIDGEDDEMATFEIPSLIFSSNKDASVSFSDEIIIEVKDPHSSIILQ